MADENETQATPYTRWWWISAGFLLLIAILVSAALMFGLGRDNPAAGPTANTTAASPGTSGSSTPSGSAGPAEGACAVPDGSQEIPVQGPDAAWSPQGYLLVPSSDVYGPVEGADPIWPCFAHSPTGSLFAAAHFVAGMGGLPEEYENFARAAAVDNQALTSWLDQQSPEEHQQDAGNVAQYVGFRFQKVEPDSVVVDLALQQQDITGYFRISLVWDAVSDNWKGDVATSQLQMAAADDVSTFTRWGAADG